MVENVETVVVGAGVVGLATARALAMAGREVLVLEKAGAIGTETSSRNSEVIHAGIYYAKGSLKARLCLAGRDALYRYCCDHGVNYRRLGKLIVATAENELATLASIRDRGEANGVGDLAWLEAVDAQAMEPELSCAAALHSPSTGIIDCHGLMLAYRGDLEEHGGFIAFHSALLAAKAGDNGFLLTVGIEGGSMALACRHLVNAAGLHAQDVAAVISGLAAHHVPRRYLSKGCYFSMNGHSPFRRLIYPVPDSHGGLGVHLTLDLAGQARFGPDTERIDRIDYDVPPQRDAAFYDAVRRYYPALPDGALQPAYAGIRPTIQGPGQPVAGDFIIQGPGEHGVPGLVNMFGIESPGLTASLAIADQARNLLMAS